MKFIEYITIYEKSIQIYAAITEINDFEKIRISAHVGYSSYFDLYTKLLTDSNGVNSWELQNESLK